MPRVDVELPSVLTGLLGVPRVVPVEASCLADALRELSELHPTIDVHLFDETGGFREHVLCFHNDTNTRWLDGTDVALADGDRITIMQAVSGG
ncbi:MAG: hypothetical protein HKO59_04165 [Phycisphaerales bacterium]|nr:MoaD/ThiS family protein [Phycisphaerae bacterium]NNM25173.1 hypothetical protein [Phycisphaerales bacterium]